MASTLNNYNPQYWANQALMLLTTRKGYASRIFRGYEGERESFGRGDVINFRKPMKFTAEDIFSSAPTAIDLDPPKSSLTLDSHFAVRFKVSDKDLVFAGDRLVTEHIAPAVDALAQKLDLDVATMFTNKIPHVVATTLSTTNAATLLSNVRKKMVENLVPRDGKPLTYVASPATMALMLQNTAFTQFQGADGAGVAAQTSGDLGMKFGFSWFETTNIITGRAVTVPNDTTGALSAAHLSSVTSIAVDNFGTSEVIAAGQILTIAGDSYVVKTGATMSSGAGTLVLEVPTRQAYANNAVVLLTSDVTTAVDNDIAFHPSAAALVVAPLPMHASSLGASIYTATDPASGLSVRARLNYDNVAGDVNVILDVLYGMAIIDQDLAVRVEIA